MHGQGGEEAPVWRDSCARLTAKCENESERLKKQQASHITTQPTSNQFYASAKPHILSFLFIILYFKPDHLYLHFAKFASKLLKLLNACTTLQPAHSTTTTKLAPSSKQNAAAASDAKVSSSGYVCANTNTPANTLSAGVPQPQHHMFVSVSLGFISGVHLPAAAAAKRVVALDFDG